MLPSQIERLFDEPPAQYTEEHLRLFREFKDALNRGEIRAAEPDPSSKTGWRANAWVKKVVPGGSSIRDGSFVGRGVICMPPMFINVGGYVGEGTMIDSHALVGSCAQVGGNCHISAGAQIGGVLEPVGALPVVLEDEVLVGGNCGVYEGTVVKRRAVLGTGTILNRSIPVYDLIRDAVYTATDSDPLVIPEQAIVVPGSRAVSHAAGAKWGLSLQAAVIVKYRDAKTDARVQLEDLLR